MTGEDSDKRKRKWTLKSSVIDDARDVFRKKSAKDHYLRTNAKTWGRLEEHEGVKKDKAREVGKAFVKFLKGVNDGSIPPDNGDFDADDAKELFVKRYAKIAEERDYEQLIERLDD